LPGRTPPVIQSSASNMQNPLWSSSSQHPNAHPFFGIVETTVQALRLVRAARLGVIPRVIRRLNDRERSQMIASGAVFVFSAEESGIRRWTDGRLFLSSRIDGNFLVSERRVHHPCVRRRTLIPASQPSGVQGAEREKTWSQKFKPHRGLDIDVRRRRARDPIEYTRKTVPFTGVFRDSK
jgi:hypothetical protein